MSRSKPQKRWTLLAGLCFGWNVSAWLLGPSREVPPISALARRHKKVAIPVYIALGWHFWGPHKENP